MPIDIFFQVSTIVLRWNVKPGFFGARFKINIQDIVEVFRLMAYLFRLFLTHRAPLSHSSRLLPCLHAVCSTCLHKVTSLILTDSFYTLRALNHVTFDTFLVHIYIQKIDFAISLPFDLSWVSHCLTLILLCQGKCFIHKEFFQTKHYLQAAIKIFFIFYFELLLSFPGVSVPFHCVT